MTKGEIARIAIGAGLLPYSGGKQKVMVFYVNRMCKLSRLATIYTSDNYSEEQLLRKFVRKMNMTLGEYESLITRLKFELDIFN